jgi:hypothetical protein
MNCLQTTISAVLWWLFLLTKHRHLSGLCEECPSTRQRKSGEGSSVDSLPTKTMYILNAVPRIPRTVSWPATPWMVPVNPFTGVIPIKKRGLESAESASTTEWPLKWNFLYCLRFPSYCPKRRSCIYYKLLLRKVIFLLTNVCPYPLKLNVLSRDALLKVDSLCC